MTRIERVRYETLHRVNQFGVENEKLFQEAPGASQAFAFVANAIAEIDRHSTAKLVAAREGRRERMVNRTTVLQRMKVIARTSRGVRTKSGAVLGLVMPARRSDVAVLTTARAFLREGEANLQELLKLGMPVNCLAELREAVAAFEQAISARRGGRAEVAGAQAGIDAALALGLDAARTLDIVVANTLEHDPVLFATWQRDRRVVEGKAKAVATGSSDAAVPSESAGNSAPSETAAPPDPSSPLKRAS